MGEGVAQVKMEGCFAAAVDCEAEASRKYSVPGHLAIRLQFPVPLVMVTVLPLTEQTPFAAMVAATPELVVAATVKLDW